MDKIKVLYSAGDNDNSSNLIKKVYDELSKLSWVDLYITGYDQYIPKDITYHYNLQSCGDIFCKNRRYSTARIPQELKTYWNFLKILNPDIVLADFVLPTIDLAADLGHKTYLLSNKIIMQGIKQQIQKQRFKMTDVFYNKLFNFDEHAHYMIDLVSKKLSYTQFGDAITDFDRAKNYKFIRPYYEKHELSSEKIICVFPNPTIKILKWLSEQKNIILYTNAQIKLDESKVYPLYHNSYYKNISQAKFVISDGNEMVLSDAYYNQKYSIIINKFDNLKELDVFKLQHKNAYVDLKLAEFHNEDTIPNLDSICPKKVKLKIKNSVKSLTEFLKYKFLI